jgi:transposase
VSFAFEEVETGFSAIQSELDHAAKDKPQRNRPIATAEILL